MLTIVLVLVLLAVALLYAALPLLNPRQVDPLPNERDPLLQDLEEDRDALFRAIRELDAREDVDAAGRARLRARYEAKAAGVLRTIDERRAELEGRTRPEPRVGRRSLPWGTLGLLGVMAGTALALGPFVLPRVGVDATVTTFFADDLRAAEGLRDLQRAAERDPSVPNLMTLAGAYWDAQDAAGAEAAYRRVLLAAEADAAGTAPALAYQRLAMLAVETDFVLARDYLVEARRADPFDAETLLALGELAFATGELELSLSALRDYLRTPAGEGDAEARERLELVERFAPAVAALERERSPEHLADMADLLWTEGAHDQAVELYFEVLVEHDPNEPTALARTGQLLFMRGRADDAIAVLERAAAAAGGLERLEPQASLFLGNARFAEGDDAGAIAAWETHVAVVGEDAAGRVPSLIATAEARLRGEDVDVPAAMAAAGPAGAAPGTDDPVTAPGAVAPGDDAAVAGAPGDDAPGDDAATLALRAEDPLRLQSVAQELYTAHCAACHGAAAEGGMGPRLAGNPRSAREDAVRSAITFGRGMMPGFGAVLDPDEIEVLVRWLAGTVAAGP